MSALRGLIVDGELNGERVQDRLIEYTNKLRAVNSDLSLLDKNVFDVHKEHPSLASYYDEIKSQLHTIKLYMETLKDKAASKVYLQYSEDSPYSHVYNGIQQIIKGNPDYIMYRRLELEFGELYELAFSACAQFKQRAFILNNIIKIMELELEDRTLTPEYE